MVRGYNATVSAEVNTVYEHFSAVLNKQQGYTKRELRQIVDKLSHDNVLKVEVFDRSKWLGIDATAMEGILCLVTDKLVTLMFDAPGWPRQDARAGGGGREGADRAPAVARRLRRSGSPAPATSPTSPTTSSCMKSRKDIRRTTFSTCCWRATPRSESRCTWPATWAACTASTATTRTSSGWSTSRTRRSRPVRSASSSTASGRPLFPTLVNWVAVTFRKEHGEGRDATTDQAQLTGPDVAKGTLERVIRYPRLGAQGADWLGYQYRVSWSLIRRDRSRSRARTASGWQASDPVVTLRPPLAIATAELEVDRDLMVERGVKVGVVEVEARVAGQGRDPARGGAARDRHRAGGEALRGPRPRRRAPPARHVAGGAGRRAEGRAVARDGRRLPAARTAGHEPAEGRHR